jgi:hypothetical protein
MDLELDHYSFEDLLRLFKLPPTFTNEQLKAAKKVVFAVHPDKTGLPKEYFLFFLDAYKLLVQVHSAKGGRWAEKFVPEDDLEKKEAAQRFTESKDFHGNFNGLFEKVYIRPENEEEGFGDWLKSNDDLDVSFEARKRDARSVVVKGVQEAPISSSLGASQLGTDSNSNAYTSLKHQYTAETVLGVSEEDFVPVHKSAEQLKRERSVGIAPMEESEAQRFMAEQAQKQEQIDSRRAYLMVKQSLKSEKNVGQFWAHLLRLT